MATQNVTNGQVSTGLIVHNGDILNLYEGGKTTLTGISSGGRFNVSGGTAVNTMLYEKGRMYISGGTASLISAFDSKCLGVLSNGSVTSLMVGKIGAPGNWSAFFHVSGGTLTSAWVRAGGTLRVSGGTAVSTFISSGGSVHVAGNPLFSNCQVSNGGRLEATCKVLAVSVYDGGTANMLTGGIYQLSVISAGGVVNIKAGGSAFSAGVTNSGTMNVYQSGKAEKVFVSAGGTLNLVSSGNQTGSAQADYTTVSGISATMDVSRGGLADHTTVSSGGHINVFGSASNTYVSSQGRLVVSSGGTATETSAYGAGVVHVKDGGTAVNTVLSGAAGLGVNMWVSAGGTASATTVQTAGSLGLIGGTASGTVVSNGGKLTVSSPDVDVSSHIKGVASDTVISQGGSVLVSGGTLTGGAVSAGGSAIVKNYGVADGVTLSNGGSMFVSTGGQAQNMILSGGRLYVSTGGLASDARVFGGSMRVSTGAMAFGTIVNQVNAQYTIHGHVYDTVVMAGYLQVGSGLSGNSGSAWDSLLTGANASVGVRENGLLSRVQILEGASAYVISSGLIQSATVSGGGRITVSGGTVSKVVVSNGGQLSVSCGGIVQDMTVLAGGLTDIQSGTVRNATISDGTISVSAGGIVAGKITLAGTAELQMEAGAQVRIDLSAFNVASPDPQITDWSRITGSPDYVVRISSTQALGNYVLATNAAGFDETITVKNTNDSSVGSLTVGGESLYYNTEYYRLRQVEGNLLLSVTDTLVVKPEVLLVSADVTEPTNGNVSVSAVFSDNATTKQYSLNNSTWNDYTGAVTMNGNGSVYFRCSNAEGDSPVSIYTVNNIDKTPPTAPVVTVNTTALTAGPVIITATYSDDSAEKVFSGDGVNWSNYTGPISVNNNCDYWFKGIDAVGNESTVTELNITNIITDSVPEQPYAYADITYPTNGTVTVTAEFYGDPAKKQYSLNNQTWNTYTAPVKMSNNGKVWFRGLNVLDQASPVYVVTVDNIDKTPPAAPTASQDITGPTNDFVLVDAVFSGDTWLPEYSLDNSNWDSYYGPVTIFENGTVYFRGTDLAGNISQVTSWTVSNIDKTPPTEPVVTASTTAETYDPVKLTAVFSNDTVKKQYSNDLVNWKSYTGPVTATENGSWYFLATDAAGNESMSLFEVGNILAEPVPDMPVPSANITEWTNKDVTVSAQFPGNAVKKEYSLDGKTWKNYTGGIVMKNNGTVYFRAANSKGEYSPVSEYIVYNIDKVAPAAPEIYISTEQMSVLPVHVWAFAHDDATFVQYSLDKKNWQDSQLGSMIEVTENRTIYFRAFDAAGNVSPITAYEVKNIYNPDKYVVHANAADNPETQMPLDYSGKYDFYGTFGDITGTMTILNGGKKIGSVKLVDGNPTGPVNKGQPLLLDNSQPTVIQVTVKSGTDLNYFAQLYPVEMYNRIDNGDDGIEGRKNVGVISAPDTVITDGWVGFGDPIDYAEFTLAHAANLILDLTSFDATKFTLYNTAGKSVQRTTIKKGQNTLLTKAKLLEAGRYYLSIQSTNAKKGGSADYSVKVAESTTFYTKGDNSDDTAATAKDLGVISQPGNMDSGWVGYGDVYDYKKITLATAAKLSFRVGATGALVKFTVSREVKGKLRSVGNVSVKANTESNSKDLFLEAGTYYLAVQSTTAKRGGSADYAIALNDNTRFYTQGDNGNDTWQAASQRQAKLAGEVITGWVGFGDASDFIKFHLDGEGQVQLNLNDATANELAAKRIKLTCLDANGKSVAVAFDKNAPSLVFSKKPVGAGDYYLGVTCSNVKKYDSNYSITVGQLAVV